MKNKYEYKKNLNLKQHVLISKYSFESLLSLLPLLYYVRSQFKNLQSKSEIILLSRLTAQYVVMAEIEEKSFFKQLKIAKSRIILVRSLAKNSSFYSAFHLKLSLVRFKLQIQKSNLR